MTIAKVYPLTTSVAAEGTDGQEELFATGDVGGGTATRSETIEAQSPVGGAFGQAGWEMVCRGLEHAWEWLDSPLAQPIRLREALFEWCAVAAFLEREPDLGRGLLRTLALLDPHQLTYLLRCGGVPTELVEAGCLRRALAAQPVTTHTDYLLCGHTRMTAWVPLAPWGTPRVYRARDACPRCRASEHRARAEAAGWATLLGGVREVALAEEMRAMHLPALAVERGTAAVSDVLTRVVGQELAQCADANWWVRQFPWQAPRAIQEVLEAAMQRATPAQLASVLAAGDQDLRVLAARAVARRRGSP